MSKKMIVALVAGLLGFAILVLVFLKRTADIAQKRSDTIMQQFKNAEKELEKGRLRVDSLNRGLLDSADIK